MEKHKKKKVACPKCEGEIVFIIANDGTLCLAQCENGKDHISDASKIKEIEENANTAWKESQSDMASEFADIFKGLLMQDIELLS